jgi:predicted transcriptional regulator
LSEIHRLRKKLGITQTELAKKSGVSQSLIARIEAGAVDPRYTKAAEIFRALDEIQSKEITAGEIMTKTVFGVKTTDNVAEAAKKLEKNKVSQLPVYRGSQIVGSITESTISAQISRGLTSRELSTKRVEEAMEDSFPTVSEKTPVSAVSTLLEHAPAVLVSDAGETKGIITKADLLKIVRA